MNESAGPRWQAWGWVATSALAASCIVLGDFHREDHADALLPILVSLQRWTPFFWGQNRYGMLVPLLALPIRSPFWNLLFQEGFDIFCGLAAIGLLARHAFKRLWLPVAATSAAAYLAFAPRTVQHNFLGSPQPYGVALALAWGALLLVESRRWERAVVARLALSCALSLLASWVNLAVLQATVPYVLIEAHFASPVRWRLSGIRTALKGQLGLELASIGFGFAGGRLLAWAFVRMGSTAMGLLPISGWAEGWGELGRHLLALLGETPWVWVVLGLGVAGGASVLLKRRLPPPGAIALVGSALASFAVLGVLRWVHVNEGHPRYLSPALVMAAVAISGVAWTALSALGEHRAVGWVSCGAVLLAAVAGHGWPSLERTRQGVSAEPLLAQIEDARVTHLAGPYWTVMPVLFRVLLARHESGSTLPVYALTDRSRETLSKAREVAEPRIALLAPNDAETEHWLQECGFWPVEPMPGPPGLVVARPVR